MRKQYISSLKEIINSPLVWSYISFEEYIKSETDIFKIFIHGERAYEQIDTIRQLKEKFEKRINILVLSNVLHGRHSMPLPIYVVSFFPNYFIIKGNFECWEILNLRTKELLEFYGNNNRILSYFD